MTPRQIAFLTGTVSRNVGGGLYESVRRLAVEQTVINRSRILVFGLEDSHTHAEWQGPPLTTTRVFGPRSFGFAPQLFQRLDAAQPDLLHQHGLWMYPSIVCSRWSLQTRKPYIISPHGMLNPWDLSNSSWKKRPAAWIYENHHLRRAACLHALSEAEALAMRQYGLKNPICVVPNGIDSLTSLEALPPQWEDAGTRGARVLLYLGRLHPKKNLRNLLRGWSAVQHRNCSGHNWRLVIAGWDENGYEHELKEAARDLEIADSIRFVGPQTGAAKHATLRRANAFVLPSLSEGLPMAVLEAWSYGLPVLMTPQCNLPEGFEAGAALRFTTEPEFISTGLASMLEMSEASRVNMGTRGQKLVRERFTWPLVGQQMCAVYEWCLGIGSKPKCVVN